jgi:L-ascorbate metabolism protein UlaG (beta-lactamase superfamily)
VTTRLRFLGVAAYEIVGPGQRILIDPFLSGNPGAPCAPDDLERPDVILVTHAAPDHLGDALAIARRTGAPVVCGADVRALLLDQGLPGDQVRATVWGIVVEVGGVRVRPVECRHWSMATLSDGRTVSGVPLAFIVEPEPGLRVYHYGDTAVFDMRLLGELYRPTVGLLGCCQPRDLLHLAPGAGRLLSGEMDPREAALAAEMLGLRLAVACHYSSTADPDVQAFLRLVPQHDPTGRRRALALEPGETIELEPEPDATDPPARPAQGAVAPAARGASGRS